MIDPNVFAEEIFGFHAQQATEKALKAWLSFLSIEYPRTHDLSLLIGMLREQGQDVEGLYDLRELNKRLHPTGRTPRVSRKIVKPRI